MNAKKLLSAALFTGIFLFSGVSQSQTKPFWHREPRNHGAFSSINFRILNRKHVHHLVAETVGEHYRITLLVHHPKPWGYKAKSHPLYIELFSLETLRQRLDYLDQYLENGYNFKIWLDGSKILRMHFIETNKVWDFRAHSD